MFLSFSWFSIFPASWTKTVASEIFAQNRLQHMTFPRPKSPHLEFILAWTPSASVKNSSPKRQQNHYFATLNVPEFGFWFLASFTAGVCKINLQNNITCRIPSLQAILILKIRVARTLDQFQGPNVLRNRVVPSFSSFSNFSVAWNRPWPHQISGHRIFWTMRLGRNQDTCFNSVLTEGYQNPTEGSWEILN